MAYLVSSLLDCFLPRTYIPTTAQVMCSSSGGFAAVSFLRLFLLLSTLLSIELSKNVSPVLCLCSASGIGFWELMTT